MRLPIPEEDQWTVCVLAWLYLEHILFSLATGMPMVDEVAARWLKNLLTGA